MCDFKFCGSFCWRNIHLREIICSNDKMLGQSSSLWLSINLAFLSLAKLAPASSHPWRKKCCVCCWRETNLPSSRPGICCLTRWKMLLNASEWRKERSVSEAEEELVMTSPENTIREVTSKLSHGVSLDMSPGSTLSTTPVETPVQTPDTSPDIILVLGFSQQDVLNRHRHFSIDAGEMDPNHAYCMTTGCLILWSPWLGWWRGIWGSGGQEGGARAGGACQSESQAEEKDAVCSQV